MRVGWRTTGCVLLLLVGWWTEPAAVASAGGRPLESRLSPLAVAGVGVNRALFLEYDAVAADTLPRSGPFVLAQFPLPLDRSVDLLVERFDVLAPGASVVVASADGEHPLEVNDVSLYRGYVLGKRDSRVFLSLSRRAQHGFIMLEGRTFIISSGPPASLLAPMLFDLNELANDDSTDGSHRGFECFTDTSHFIPPDPYGTDDYGEDPSAYGARCRVAQVAVDTDWEYTGWIFGGDTQASASYALTLFGAVSEIYTRDVNTRLEISYLRVWDADVDPYAGGGLGEFQNHWNAHMRHIPRHAAHILSPMYGGGVAYLPGLCNWGYEYGLSGALGGYFPYPLRDRDQRNWDPFVVAHELGHNFGAPHTHDHQPPIDGCGLGDCSQRFEGTIMSYCHLCRGGLYNISLKFAGRTITETILPYLDRWARCDLTGAPACDVTCDDIKRFRARCKSYGVLAVKVILHSDVHTGQDLVLSFNGVPRAFRIGADRIHSYYCCPQYPVTIAIENPGGCVPPLVLDCP